ncbi:serine hydrolase domain-containing protein [Novosphingobium sp. 9]|uniref:serine hydrolase domain-containing protein n=1 Tax=Novosphingobium sp. 9 TaxID=2025349 RepID=UPI0021B6864F|nr:serine hydrolase domain-containing protein [Novosphingobium sp. 9]
MRKSFSLALAGLLVGSTLNITPATAQAAAPAAAAAPSLSATQLSAIDQAVSKILADSGVPSAQVAVTQGGRIVLARAWGKAGEGMPAQPDQPYQIASNSKQFLAALILKLQDEGKLSLDDHVSKYLDGISGGDTITIRQLLSHTSGLRDFWPQDYMFSDMTKPISPQEILHRWASAPLDYTPGTRWQYSNTGYVVAGLIAEKVGGAPLWQQLETTFFKPLSMHPLNIDDTNKPGFPQGYHRYALGPVEPATPPAAGWLWAAGELSMTASDLARWDIARLNRQILTAKDWEEQESPVILADGTDPAYGLGVSSGVANGRRFINHGGESVGFLSQNTVYPDSDVAIVVLTNADFGSVTGSITQAIADIVMPKDLPADSGQTQRADDAKAQLQALIAGTFDPAKFTEHARFYFTPIVRRDYKSSLAPLGPVTAFAPVGKPRLRGGFVNRNFEISFGAKKLHLVTYAEPGAAGRWEQFIVMPAD